MALLGRGPASPIEAAVKAAGLTLSDVTAVEAAPVPVWLSGDLTPEAALRCWAAARAAHSTTGLYPVLVGEGSAFRDAVDDAVELAAEDDPEEPQTAAQVLAVRLEEMQSDAEEDGEPDEFLAEEPSLADRMDIAEGAFLSLDGPQAVAFVESPSGAAIPGLLMWTGAINYELTGQQHSAVLAEWESRWGAELVVLGFAVIELAVSRPPDAGSDVLSVARDQYLYCPDLVTQGVQSIGALCSAVASRHWYFWWD